MIRPARRSLLTVEDLDAIPDDGRRYELQAGLLISEPAPGWRHGRVAARIATLLDAHVRKNGLGVVVSNDTGFILSRSPDTVLGPDVSFVSRERLEKVGDPVTAFPGAPDLAVEILSPSNTPRGIHAKVADYLAAGTSCVWIVDPHLKTIIEHRSLLAPRTLQPEDVLEAQDILPGLVVRVEEVFEL
jgi:Uma2 family endonuclease